MGKDRRKNLTLISRINTNWEKERKTIGSKNEEKNNSGKDRNKKHDKTGKRLEKEFSRKAAETQSNNKITQTLQTQLKT